MNFLSETNLTLPCTAGSAAAAARRISLLLIEQTGSTMDVLLAHHLQFGQRGNVVLSTCSKKSYFVNSCRHSPGSVPPIPRSARECRVRAQRASSSSAPASSSRRIGYGLRHGARAAPGEGDTGQMRGAWGVGTAEDGGGRVYPSRSLYLRRSVLAQQVPRRETRAEGKGAERGREGKIKGWTPEVLDVLLPSRDAPSCCTLYLHGAGQEATPRACRAGPRPSTLRPPKEDEVST